MKAILLSANQVKNTESGTTLLNDGFRPSGKWWSPSRTLDLLFFVKRNISASVGHMARSLVYKKGVFFFWGGGGGDGKTPDLPLLLSKRYLNQAQVPR